MVWGLGGQVMMTCDVKVFHCIYVVFQYFSCDDFLDRDDSLISCRVICQSSLILTDEQLFVKGFGRL